MNSGKKSIVLALLLLAAIALPATEDLPDSLLFPNYGEKILEHLKHTNLDSLGRRPRIGLVLSGGGALGLTHIGALRALEEAGIKVDYITGTSMGSIMGCLYSVGYNSKQIEEMVAHQDWNALLMDEIPRNQVSFEEKADYDRYSLSFPIRGLDISLPSGLVAGQNFYAYLSELTMSIHHIYDFNRLPIPFRCIATDIETGEAVVLDHGYLPDAIRASMSIPSMFIPFEVEGKLLVDGGLVRNFPVSDVLDMGADIVIGVNVANTPAKRDKLTSIINILSQAISFSGFRNTAEQRKLVDIYISPDTGDNNILDFDAADTLIAAGYRAAVKRMDELNALSDYMSQYMQVERSAPKTTIDSLYIVEIGIEGLKNVSRDLVYGKLTIPERSRVTPEEIQHAIERLYGSQCFDLAMYRLEPVAGGVKLIVRVKERSANLFKVGLHYDNVSKSALLFNGTFRNLMLDGSKLSANVKLGDQYGWDLRYYLLTGRHPGVGFEAGYWEDKMDMWTYGVDNEKESYWDYYQGAFTLQAETLLDNTLTLGTGGEMRASRLELRNTSATFEASKTEGVLFDYFIRLEIDTLEELNYPRKGKDYYCEFRSCSGIFDITDTEGRLYEQKDNFQRVFFRAYRAIPLWKKSALQLRGYYGFLRNYNSMFPEYVFHMGGMKLYRDTRFVPLIGLHEMQKSGTNVLSAMSSYQYEAYDDVYVILTAGLGKTACEYDDLWYKKHYIWGYGVTLAIDTPVGPIEYTWMSGNVNKNGISYVNIGYKF